MNTCTSFASPRATLSVALAILVAVIVAPSARARSLPALDRRVVDEAGALDPAARERLDATLADYARRTGHQFAVVILRGLDGDVLEQLSVRAAEQWRLGDKRRDDGLLVVMAVKERTVRIEVGYGLEGVVTDAFASGVIRDTMAPRFAQGDVAGGLEAGLSSLMQAAAGESVGVGPGAASTVRQAPSLLQLAPPIMFVFVVIVTGLARRRGGQGRGDGGGGLLALGILMSVLGGGRGGYGGGGGFSGGGGSFGGGGASGRW